jgi:hypothetical protein
VIKSIGEKWFSNIYPMMNKDILVKPLSNIEVFILKGQAGLMEMTSLLEMEVINPQVGREH